MMLKTWPVRALFKYVFKRVLGTFVKTDINPDLLDFSSNSLKLNDLEMNTYEINKLMSSSLPPFKLVSMTIGQIEVPWKLFMFQWSEVKVSKIEAILMPAPSRAKGKNTHSEKESFDEGNFLNYRW